MTPSGVALEASSVAGTTAELVRTALREDAPTGDLTTSLVVPARLHCRAQLVVNRDGVLAGLLPASAALTIAAEQDGLGGVEARWSRTDGARFAARDVVATFEGPARTILRAERVAINLLSHLSGVATLTRSFVDAAAPARILCTRKTTPGIRELERDAVVSGGGVLHRASLSQAVLVKDNHVKIAGSVSEAVRRARATGLAVEVEVESIAQLEEALRAGADRVLLDNFSPDLVRSAIARVGQEDRIEVSGGVTLDNVAEFVAAGACWISVGAITHSAPAMDMSLEVVD